MNPDQKKELIGLLKEARLIIRANPSFRHMHKDWIERATKALQKEQPK